MQKKLCLLIILTSGISLLASEQPTEKSIDAKVMSAIRSKDVKLLGELVPKRSQDKAFLKNFLYWALMIGNADTALPFIENGAQVNEQTGFGPIKAGPLTIVVEAIKNDEDALAKLQLLVNHGADVNQIFGERTLLQAAINRGNEAVVTKLASLVNNATLYHAIRYHQSWNTDGNKEMLTQIILNACLQRKLVTMEDSDESNEQEYSCTLL